MSHWGVTGPRSALAPEQAIPVASAQSQRRTGDEQHLVLAVPLGTDLTDAVEIHDRRAMDSRELRRVELPLEVRHRHPHSAASGAAARTRRTIEAKVAERRVRSGSRSPSPG